METLPPELQELLLTDVDIRATKEDPHFAGMKLTSPQGAVLLVATRPMLLELARQAQMVADRMPKEA